MKKFIAILLIALCFLTACGEDSESKSPDKNDPAGNATSFYGITTDWSK